MTTLFKQTVFLILLSLFSLINVSPVLAQDVEGAATLGVAKIVEVNAKDVKDGSVISASKNGAILSNTPYDPQVIGVVARDAAILIETSSAGVPVISSGKIYILVSSKNGMVKKGDLLTSSTIPGVAAKADKDGYVLGTALEDATSNNPNQVEQIAADLDLHYFNSRPTFPGTLSDVLKIVLLPTKESPAPIFKYIVAAGVVLASIVLGFMSFGRTAAKGIEALGRNPAASKIIHMGIIFNIVIVVVIVGAGLTIGFLILRI